MSLLEKGVRSQVPEEHLETMKRTFLLGDIKKRAKLYAEESKQYLTANFVPELFEATYLPVDVKVADGSQPLPIAVIEELIRRSPHRVISKTCTCRDEHDCKEHSKYLGCIHIGEATEEESEELCHHATVEEAIDHLHKCVDDGLMPFIGHVFADHVFWDVHPERPFLTVCMCCDCCCGMFDTFRNGFAEDSAYERFVPMDGLKITVDTDKCVGCGICAKACFSHCIEIQNGKAVIAADKCKGCSACTIKCPNKAISITIDDVGAAVDALLERLNPQVGGLPLDEYEFKL